MKICHLTSVHPATDIRIFNKECITLRIAGFKVDFVVPGATSEFVGGIQIHGVEKIEGSRYKRMTHTVRRVFEKALEIDADIYHFHDPELIPVGLKLKKKNKIVIYDVHEDVPRQILTKKWLPGYSKQIVSFIFEMYENISVKKFDLIVAATPHIEERFKKLKVRTVNVNNYPIQTVNVESNVSWSNKKDMVCYAGGLSALRGMNEMIDAIELQPMMKLGIAGRFSVNNERETVSQKKGWSQVIEYGYVDQKTVKEIYSESIAGLVLLHPMPSYLVSLPVKMFEYMSAGIPVIASDFPLWKEIINTNKCGICVNPLNPEEIAKAISYLRNNPTEAEEMGRNGRKAIENIYNWEQEGEKLVEVYKTL